jgi:hypothetical protein
VAHLSGGPVAWLGDHSYGVYLWHWPLVIVLPWALHEPLGHVARFGVLAATLLLAWLTKRYVEDPVRAGAAWRLRRWASVGLATAGTAALVLATTVVWTEYDKAVDHQAHLALASVRDKTPCFGAAAMVERGCNARFAKPAGPVVDFAAADMPPVRPRCQSSAAAAPHPTWCRFGDLSSPRSTIALVGNSYAVHLVPLVLEWTRGQHVRILLAARTDCLGLSTVPVEGQLATDPCLQWSTRVQARLMGIRNLSLLVLTSHPSSDEFLAGREAPGAATLAQVRRNVLGSLRLFAAVGVPTVVVKHVPGTRPFFAPECVARAQVSYDPCALPRGPVTKMDFLAKVAQQHPRLTSLLSLDRYFCSRRQCHAVIGGVVAYFDDHHMSATYARTLARYVGPRLAQVMAITRTASPRGS